MIRRHATSFASLAIVAPLLFIAAVAAATVADAQTVDEVLTSKVDLWGEAALKQPDGPTYAFFEDKLPPFRYVETPKPAVVLPERERHEHYSRQAVPPEMLVPEVY